MCSHWEKICEGGQDCVLHSHQVALTPYRTEASYWETSGHLGFSLLCSEMQCSSRSMNFWGKAVKSTRRPCWTFKLFKLQKDKERKKFIRDILITPSTQSCTAAIFCLLFLKKKKKLHRGKPKMCKNHLLNKWLYHWKSSSDIMRLYRK